jgi:hypothetical protein
MVAPGEQVRAFDDLGRGAAGEQLAIGDVGDVVAALGLVHVMGRDEHGEAARGERVDLVPEGAARLRIDAGGRLVEEEQLRLVERRDGKREALLPAARKSAGELAPALGESELVERFRDPLAAPVEAVDARAELEILFDRQVLVEREALRHVSGAALDLAALLDDVEAERFAMAAVRRE